MGSKTIFLAVWAVLIIMKLPSWTFAVQTESSREVLSLDGNWEIAFDSLNRGRENGWHTMAGFSANRESREIPVPSCWERFERDYEGVAFYRRRFDVPQDWENRIVRLQFDAVNYRAEVWLNDEVVGFHQGGFTPFEFRVDELLRVGEENSLILRVVGPVVLTKNVIDGIGPLETPQWRGGITGGIWQSVRLVATGIVYISDVFVEPRISSDNATFHVELYHTGILPETIGFHIEIGHKGNSSAPVAELHDEWALNPGINQQQCVMVVPNALYWSPDDPQLYEANLRIVSTGRESDRRKLCFGMRELTIRDKVFYLNKKPIYIKAAFFEGLYPVGIAYPDTEEMARREIRLAKEAGFNMIRPWRKPPPPMWLDLADEMGVMTVGSFAVECMTLPKSSPYLPAMVLNELRESILRDRNRACIVQWELFNELHRPILKQMMLPMALMARDLDPTRLILDESGGWAFGANMYLPYERVPTKFNDIHTYPGPFLSETLYDGFLAIGLRDEERKERGLTGKPPGRNVLPELMSFVSEVGYGSLPDLVSNNRQFLANGNPLTPAFRYHQSLLEGQLRMLRESGFENVYSDLQLFCFDQQSIHGAANKRMIEAIRSNPGVAGYCVHALTGGDWVLGAGLLDLWRGRKTFAYEGTSAANRPRILPIRIRPRNIYAEKGAVLEITGVNDLETVEGELSIRIVTADGSKVFEKDLKTTLSQGVSQLFNEEVATDKLDGSYIVNTGFRSTAGLLLAQNSYEFDVFQSSKLKPPEERILLLDQNGPLADFLLQRRIEFEQFGELLDLDLPVFVTKAAAVNPHNHANLARLRAYIWNGGTAVYLQVPGVGLRNGVINPAENRGFPFPTRLEKAKGLWTCIPHIVHDHPVFDGLPANGMMRDIYENVWADTSLLGLGGETIVASIGFQWFSPEHELGYLGPGSSWWGTDMAIVPYGKGRCLVSQLRIVEHLGQDPVADKLLFNMIRFVSDQH